jgi:Domain of unknown function (DUF3883)
MVRVDTLSGRILMEDVDGEWVEGSCGLCLVLAMNDLSESSIEYADIPFVSYEYPTRYRKKIQPGKRFLYYRGRRRPEGGRQPQAYLGAGIIGEIWESESPGRLVCQILDGEEFLVPLPFKDEHGGHLEPGGSRSGYFQQGVREIPEDVYQRIMALAGAGPMDGLPFRIDNNADVSPSSKGLGEGYASTAVAQETERQSRSMVVDFFGRVRPGIRVVEMATNNPGFDLETSAPRFRFVEVKGTSKPVPTFFLSEGERRFAQKHADAYLLAVVYGMDLSRETYNDIALSRAPLVPGDLLAPTQWSGRLPISRDQDSLISP